MGRFGPFLGCSDYPACKTILKLDKQGKPLPPKPPAEPTGVKCHKCKTGELVIRQSKRGPFLGCSKFPRCRTIVSMKNMDELKKLQAEGQWPPASEEQAQNMLALDTKTPSPAKRKKSSSQKTGHPHDQ
ncbi:MAG: topoisomerase DNA-binding C4 zinc finger domain-containing protein [Planctomycetales bacterium]|nr:topoisomerase DNA-binding C4 zinc finger domain-containing protein [Planctomycetales bacterium]